MASFSRILCVIDPTNKAQPALARATWLAKHSGAAIDLLICYYNEHLNGDRFFDSASLKRTRKELLDRYRSNLESMAEPIREQAVEVTTAAIWDHPLHEGIVRHANEVKADVVFKDTHHHSALSRSFLTNTDWNLIRTCPVPLWLVKPGDVSESPLFLAALDPLNEHDKPATLDGQLLNTSKAIAADVDGDVHAFHAFDPTIAIINATGYAPVPLLTDDIQDEMRKEHEDKLNSIAESCGIDEEHKHVVSGKVFEQLPKLADQLDAAVVVMGAVSRNSIKRIFIGSTAERTLEHLPCDLLIIKPNWFRSPVDMQISDAA